uniref:Zinc finger and BTB domain containing 41 n=1 Tax=Eptatretus burgeri TaxID=7764 RepID=A0A8C4NN49_EPTBU
MAEGWQGEETLADKDPERVAALGAWGGRLLEWLDSDRRGAGHHCDVTLVTGSRVSEESDGHVKAFPAHRAVLAAACPVLGSYLTAHPAELTVRLEDVIMGGEVYRNGSDDCKAATTMPSNENITGQNFEDVETTTLTGLQEKSYDGQAEALGGLLDLVYTGEVQDEGVVGEALSLAGRLGMSAVGGGFGYDQGGGDGGSWTFLESMASNVDEKHLGSGRDDDALEEVIIEEGLKEEGDVMIIKKENETQDVENGGDTDNVQAKESCSEGGEPSNERAKDRRPNLSEIRWRCEACGRAFVYRKSLENHVAQMHASSSSTDGIPHRQWPGPPPRYWPDSDNELSITTAHVQSARRHNTRRLCHRPCNGHGGEMEVGQGSKDGETEGCDAVLSGLKSDAVEVENKKTRRNPKCVGAQQEACGSVSDRVVGVRKGQRQRRSQERCSWTCKVCGKSFQRRAHLVEHEVLHTTHTPYACAQCGQSFRSRFTRLKHQEKAHLGPFPCHICGRSFNDSGNLRRHVRCTHGGDRRWICPVCGKAMRERLHMRVHQVERKYSCRHCSKRFLRQDHLTKHENIHSGEKSHMCETCGKCFGRQDHLSIHHRSVHLGEKVWQRYQPTMHECSVCKKLFKGKSSLDVHLRTHSGERPFPCHICGQRFSVRKSLSKHQLVHSDARPHACTICSSTFKRKDKLKYHMEHVHRDGGGHVGLQGAEGCQSNERQEKGEEEHEVTFSLNADSLNVGNGSEDQTRNAQLEPAIQIVTVFPLEPLVETCEDQATPPDAIAQSAIFVLQDSSGDQETPQEVRPDRTTVAFNFPQSASLPFDSLSTLPSTTRMALGVPAISNEVGECEQMLQVSASQDLSVQGSVDKVLTYISTSKAPQDLLSGPTLFCLAPTFNQTTTGTTTDTNHSWLGS